MFCFYLVANLRRNRKNISRITYNGIFYTTPNDIKKVAVSFYSKLFNKSCSKRDKMGPADYKKLSLERSHWLQREVSMKEVKKTVWDYDVTKSPGSEGFNFKFYMKAWSLICHDMMDLVAEVFRTKKLPKGVNLAYVTLIPKTEESKGFSNYRPISMAHGILYKIVAKVLSNRLKHVIQDLIGDSQITFIAGRKTTDGFTIENEVVHELQTSGKAGMMFKVDFHKAFDTVL